MHQTASVLLNRLLARARFRHMQVLVQLAELGSLRRTAQAVGMTQPGVTQILADLESMVATPLFHRHARGVRPTAACADLLPMARQMLQGMAMTAEAIAAHRLDGEGVVRMIASTAAMNGLLVHALPQFNDRHPSLQVQLREGEGDELLLAPARGEADMVCCRRPSVVPEGWDFQALLADRFVVACSASHRLARKSKLDWADFAQEIWLPPPVGSAARACFDVLSERMPGELQQCQVITRVMAATWWLLRNRPLLTIVPYGVVHHLVQAGELAALNLSETLPLEPIGMLLPQQDVHAATAQLAEFLRQFAAAHPPAAATRRPRKPSTRTDRSARPRAI